MTKDIHVFSGCMVYQPSPTFQEPNIIFFNGETIELQKRGPLLKVCVLGEFHDLLCSFDSESESKEHFKSWVYVNVLCGISACIYVAQKSVV